MSSHSTLANKLSIGGAKCDLVPGLATAGLTEVKNVAKDTQSLKSRVLNILGRPYPRKAKTLPLTTKEGLAKDAILKNLLKNRSNDFINVGNNKVILLVDELKNILESHHRTYHNVQTKTKTTFFPVSWTIDDVNGGAIDVIRQNQTLINNLMTGSNPPTHISNIVGTYKGVVCEVGIYTDDTGIFKSSDLLIGQFYPQ